MTLSEMSEHDKYLFDLQGFLIVKDFLSADEVARLNAALDANWDKRNDGALPPYTSDAIEGGADRLPQGLFNDMLTWDQPWCQPFRDFIAHPKLIPYLDTLLGRGWHMDMAPHVFHSYKGTRGQILHGGYPHFQGGHFYHCSNGQMRNGMLVVEALLTDQPAGEGGFAAIPGSHKSNFLRPQSISEMRSNADIVVNPGAKAGDLIIFTEALGHGSLPWTAGHERRVLLYRYSPKSVAFGNGFCTYRFPDWVEELTPAQQAVLEPAYVMGRPALDEDGEVVFDLIDRSDPPGRYLPPSAG